MSHSVQMPALGESVTEGTVTRWLKNEGDQVTEDEPLLEVSTDKVDTEIPSPASGVLERILVHEDETVEVGAQLAVIGDGSGAGQQEQEGQQGQQDAAAQPAQAEQPAPAEQAQPQPESEPEAAAGSEQPAEAPSTETEQPAAQPTAGADSQPAGSGAAPGPAEGTVVTMPAMGESVTEGTITRWLKQVGDTVAVDEPLLEISTDKVDTEMPSPAAGTLLEILAQEDDTVEVGGRLAIIGEPGGAAKAPEQAAQQPAEPEPQAPSQQQAPSQEQAPAQPEPAQAEPERPAAAQKQQPAPQAQAQPEPAAPAAEERPEPGTSAGSEAARQAAPPPAPRSAA
ncbi:MAG TPA: biotin/lipoyl-containing protein, partial [Nakamurella sp.]|nr:biotin/lipoyl-containing protein [Nakamurella sp.]